MTPDPARIDFAKGHFLAPVAFDVPTFTPCGERCACQRCDIDLRQGKSLRSYEASARAIVYATLGIVALAAGAWVAL